MISPVLFLDPESKNYDRDLQYARLVYDGTLPKQAADQLEMSQNAYWKLRDRLRDRARQWAGGEVSDVMIFRLMFDRERAERALKEKGKETA